MLILVYHLRHHLTQFFIVIRIKNIIRIRIRIGIRIGIGTGIGIKIKIRFILKLRIKIITLVSIYQGAFSKNILFMIIKGSENIFDDIFLLVQVTHEYGESAKRIQNKNIFKVHPSVQYRIVQTKIAGSAPYLTPNFTRMGFIAPLRI